MDEVLAFRVDADFFKTLPEKLYSRFEDIIRENISNFYDGDCTEAHVDRLDDGRVIFTGKGKYAGMEQEDVEAFLLLGTKYKKEVKYSRHFKRLFMGQSGIGRISTFKFYRTIEVESEKDGRRILFQIGEDHLKRLASGKVEVAIKRLPSEGENRTKISLLDPRSCSLIPQADKIKAYIRANLTPLLRCTKGPFKIYVNGEEVKPPERSLECEFRLEFEEAVRSLEGAVKGEILVSSKPFPKDEQGILLTVRLSPIARKSLGELAGDRSIDTLTPPERVSGYVDAPFLEPTASRDWVDEVHPSFKEFREAMRRVAAKVEEALEKRGAEVLESVERVAFEEAAKLLRKALNADPALSQVLGSAYADADMVAVPPPKPPEDADVTSRSEPTEQTTRRPSSTSSTTVAAKPREAAAKKKCGLIIDAREFDDEGTPYYFYPAELKQPAKLVLNRRHPLYRSRCGKKVRLRNYALLMLARELPNNAYSRGEEQNWAYGSLLHAIEVAMHAPLF